MKEVIDEIVEGVDTKEQDVAYPVMELFSTLQGEGFHSGRPSLFVRLGGCDVGCHWCDVKESWDGEGFPKMTAEQVVVRCKSVSKSKFVVITGGEPSQHPLASMVHAFKDSGYEIAIETAGTNDLPEGMDWVCLSPKKFKPAQDSVYRMAHELKVVVYNKHDLKWAQEQALRVSKRCKLYIQPEWSKQEKVIGDILQFLEENPHWNLSLQTHKYLDIP